MAVVQRRLECGDLVRFFLRSNSQRGLVFLTASGFKLEGSFAVGKRMSAGRSPLWGHREKADSSERCLSIIASANHGRRRD